jgi:CDP-glucose 4,6-dehydratase
MEGRREEVEEYGSTGRPTELWQSELPAAYAGKRVLLTGHTGFKGSWLTLWLQALGAEVTGYALAPPSDPNLFIDVDVEDRCRHRLGDVRDLGHVTQVVADSQPDAVFHLAAQSLVRRSYAEPVATLETNVLGTVNVLEAVRRSRGPCAVVVVTSDKCYENREAEHAYVESEAMGGHDVYSASKGAAELVVASYRRSFFPPERLAQHGVALASARAGNVIGGGDWAQDRLVPDLVRALVAAERAAIRNPLAIRPWQHVLEPLGAYLLLGARLLGTATGSGAPFCCAWNFGPAESETRTVADVADAVVSAWGEGGWDAVAEAEAPHEASLLCLSIDKACAQLGWRPQWAFEEACARTVTWYRARHEGASKDALRQMILQQIDAYMSAAAVGGGGR